MQRYRRPPRLVGCDYLSVSDGGVAGQQPLGAIKPPTEPVQPKLSGECCPSPSPSPLVFFVSLAVLFGAFVATWALSFLLLFASMAWRWLVANLCS